MKVFQLAALGCFTVSLVSVCIGEVLLIAPVGWDSAGFTAYMLDKVTGYEYN